MTTKRFHSVGRAVASRCASFTRAAGRVFPLAMNKQQMQEVLAYLSEGRWIEYATQYPEMRPHVEMVLGRKIDWPQ